MGPCDKKKRKLLLWLTPAISVGLLYLMEYAANHIFGSDSKWGSYILYSSLFLQLIWPILIPVLLSIKKRNFRSAEVRFSISSILIASIVFISPEIFYAIEVKSLDVIDEDAVYGIFIRTILIESIIATGVAYLIQNPERKK